MTAPLTTAHIVNTLRERGAGAAFADRCRYGMCAGRCCIDAHAPTTSALEDVGGTVIAIGSFMLMLWSCSCCLHYAFAALRWSTSSRPLPARKDLACQTMCTLTLDDVTPSRPWKAAAGEDPVTCACCLEPLECGAPCRTLMCAHSYHTGCIDRWERTALASGLPVRCPLCNAVVLQLIAKHERAEGPALDPLGRSAVERAHTVIADPIYGGGPIAYGSAMMV